jgi:predicted RNA binding protein YcfA (HicA-like mRNA interferase family)
MSKYEKLIKQILSGESDRNIRFEELCHLLRRLRFDERIRGSHHIFRRHDIEEKIVLQRDNGKAKAYQVRQLRAIILRYKLEAEL